MMGKHAGGRPPHFDSLESLQEKIDEYFEEYSGYQILKDEGGNVVTNEKGKPVKILKPPTISGLSYHLGFVSRRSFYDYEYREEFSHAMEKARLRIENFAETMLYQGQPTGPIFALKNFGWSDRKEIVNKNINTEISKEEMSQLEEDVKNILKDEV
jgi:hypothetical protein